MLGRRLVPRRRFLEALLIVTLAAAVAGGQGGRAPAAPLAPSGLAPMPPCSEELSPNCLVKALPPAPGFDPIAADAAALAANGFPPRPVGDPAALAAWKDVVSDAKHYVAPDPHTSQFFHPTSDHWAGHLVESSRIGHAITFAYTQWTQPAVQFDSSSPLGVGVSFWTGIGGTPGSNIIQAGCDSFENWSAPAQPAQYACWTENYPGPTVWEGPTVHPGDVIFAEPIYNFDNKGNTYYDIENRTTGQYTAFINYTPYVATTPADFIVEKLGGALPNFGSTMFTLNHYGYPSNLFQLTTNNTRYDMVSGGRAEASGGAVDGAGNFTVLWQGR